MKRFVYAIMAVSATLAVEATVYRAGLKGGYVNSYDNGKYHSQSIEAVGVFNGPIAGTNSSNGVTSKTYPPIWVDNRTWDYHGQMYFDGGTYYFGKNIDDATYIKVNGSQVLKNEDWNKFVSSSAITLEAGWYDVVFRMGNGTGGAGCSNGTKGKDGNPLGLGYLYFSADAESSSAPSGTTDLSVIADPGDGSFLRCAEDVSYLTLNSITKTDVGYSFNVTMSAPSAANVTIYAGESAGDAESEDGWDVMSTAVEFAPGETKEVAISGDFDVPPYFIIYIEGLGTTLMEGVGIKFWEWSAIKKCTMEPTVLPVISSVTATAASFAVTLGYDKTVEGMSAPLISLKAYYGAEDAGIDGEWDDTEDFGEEISAGVANCLLSSLTEGKTYYVRFAAKTVDSDWFWSDCLSLATSGPYISNSPATLYENDTGNRSFTVARPEGTQAEELTVYLSYSANANSFLAGLPSSVVIPTGELSAIIPFTVVDNMKSEGDAIVTVSIESNANYVLGNPASVNITIIDDELIIPSVCEWTGGAGDLKWESPANWNPRVPTSVDTAKFTSIGISANDEISVASDAFIKDLIIETTTAFKLTNGGGSLQLGGITRIDVEGDEGYHDIYVPLILYGTADGKCVWNVAGSNRLRIYEQMSKVTSDVVLRIVGGGAVGLHCANKTFAGPTEVANGKLYTSAANCIKGKIYIGGGETAARVEQTIKNSFAGKTVPYVYTNGVFQGNNDIDNGRCEEFHIFEGGVAHITTYWYSIKAYLTGGTLNGGKMFNGGYGQTITSYASDTMAVFNSQFGFDGYNDGSISTEDGSPPVDLSIRKALNDGNSGKSITKNGAGTVRSTVDFNGLKNHFKINAGTWYVDNPGEYGLGLQETKVSAGAKIGGIGCVGMKDVKSYATLELSDGSEEKYATIAPGTIDETTGEHIYGTFTSGRESAHNTLLMGKYSRLEIGVGPKNRETRVSEVDKLKVYGVLSIKENCTLDLVKNTAELDSIAGGVYTIVEADKIEGTFASVLKPKDSWKVIYVTEGEGEDAVVKRIDVAIPGVGFKVFVR